jgi:hypothetical protein
MRGQTGLTPLLAEKIMKERSVCPRFTPRTFLFQLPNPLLLELPLWFLLGTVQRYIIGRLT